MARKNMNPLVEPPGTFLSDGRHRRVYAHGKFVIKIPYGPYDGLGDNGQEARLSKKYGRRPDPNGIVYARCRILNNGWLVMERVDTTWIEKDERPSWSDFIDCHQVGRARDGTIVAYDYGY